MLPKINSSHGSETRNIINEIIKSINDRGLEILSESAFLNWLDENGVKHLGEWDNTKDYDRLSVVLHEGNSYTSKKQVPVGIDIINEEFWTITGNYNAQVEQYRQDVINSENRMNDTVQEFKTDINNDIKKVNDYIKEVSLNVKQFGVMGDGITDDTDAIKSIFNQYNGNLTVYFPPGVYVITDLLCDYVNTENIKILGSHAVLYDQRDDLYNITDYEGIFKFEDCNNIHVDINYKSDLTLDLNTELGYKGGTLVKLMGDCDRVYVKSHSEKIRAVIHQGTWFSGSSMIDVNGEYGVTNLKTDITGEEIGYPLALNHGSNIEIKMNVSKVHRALYSCAISNVTGTIFTKNQYIAPFSVLISLGRDGNGNYKGCSNINLNIHDTGSTMGRDFFNLASVNLNHEYSQNRTPDEKVIFSNIELNVSNHESSTVKVMGVYTYEIGQETVEDEFLNIHIKGRNNIKNLTNGDYFIRWGLSDSAYSRGVTFELTDVKAVLFNVGLDCYTRIKSSNIEWIIVNNESKGEIWFEDSKIDTIRTATNTDEYEKHARLYLLNSPFRDAVLTQFDEVNISGITASRLRYTPTANRPDIPKLQKGYSLFDTTLQTPIYYMGDGIWRDASGNTV